MNPKPNPKFEAMWRKLTPEQRRRLATILKTTVSSLRQYADARRGISAEMAVRIEKAIEQMRLPFLSRMDLNGTCRRCEFARFCNGGRPA